MSNLFKYRYGVLVACDVETINEFKRIVEETYSIEGIVGYKVGCMLALRYGLSMLTGVVEENTDLPVIYDHQKAGTDIPQLGEGFAQACAKGGVKGALLFPQSGPKTEVAFIEALFKKNITPLVGGEMTHPKYLSSDDGFIREDAPMNMFRIAANNNVEYFVVPGNKPEVIRRYHKMLSQILYPIIPKYCTCGIGRQGGEITSAFENLTGASAYAIIGSSIYKEKDIGSAAYKYAREALEFL